MRSTIPAIQHEPRQDLLLFGLFFLYGIGRAVDSVAVAVPRQADLLDDIRDSARDIRNELDETRKRRLAELEAYVDTREK